MDEKAGPRVRGINRGKYYRRFFVFFILIVAICMGASFIPVNRISLVHKPAPLPTAMNPNFLMQVNNCFIPVAAVYGYTLRITDGFRSIADQTRMYYQGRTINGHIVTEAPPGHSLHNYGYAVDVVDRYRGYNIDWAKLVKIAAYCSLESGGVGDLPHFEERAGLTTDQFVLGMRPPLLTLPCTVMAGRTASSSPLTLKDLNACGAPKF